MGSGGIRNNQEVDQNTEEEHLRDFRHRIRTVEVHKRLGILEEGVPGFCCSVLVG